MESLTITEASKYLQISEETMYNFLHDGKLDTLKVGRLTKVKKTDLDEFLDQLKCEKKAR